MFQRHVFVLAAVLLGSGYACAEDTAQPVPPNGACSVPVDPDWDDQSKFVWEQVCAGKEANFNDPSLHFGGDLDPRNADSWPKNRQLTSKFLETILLQDKYRRALTRLGVRIMGAKFSEKIDFENAELRHELWLNKSALKGGADFSGLRSTRLLSLQGSVVSADLNLNGIQIGGDLFLDDRAAFESIQLSSAVIHGELALSGSTVADVLECEAIAVDKSISLDKGAKFAREIDLTRARVNGDINLGGGTFQKDVDLTGAQIGGELSLISYDDNQRLEAKWIGSPTLVLRNARADLIQSLSSAWAPKLDLEGFTYRGGGTVHVKEVPFLEGLIGYAKAWLWVPDPGEPTLPDSWLEKLRSYSSQPYEQLALVLQNQGDSEHATAVRYAAKEQERTRATGWRWLGLTALKWSIGYGYHVEWTLYPIAFFLIAGIVIMSVSGEDRRNALPRFGIAYCFDMLIPLIRLREKHYEIDLQGWPRVYFYVHKIMGYVLASFLIAGLAGLAK